MPQPIVRDRKVDLPLRIAGRGRCAPLRIREHFNIERARIVDVSVSGVGLQTEELPPIGTRVDVGRRTGKVVRHFSGGLAVEFQRLVPIEEFDEDIIL